MPALAARHAAPPYQAMAPKSPSQAASNEAAPAIAGKLCDGSVTICSHTRCFNLTGSMPLTLRHRLSKDQHASHTAHAGAWYDVVLPWPLSIDSPKNTRRKRRR